MFTYFTRKKNDFHFMKPIIVHKMTPNRVGTSSYDLRSMSRVARF